MVYFLPSHSSECVALQDPYCAWDKIAGKCRSHGAPRWSEENYFYQNVAIGDHTACPKISKDAKVEKQGYRGKLLNYGFHSDNVFRWLRRLRVIRFLMGFSFHFKPSLTHYILKHVAVAITSGLFEPEVVFCQTEHAIKKLRWIMMNRKRIRATA